MTYESSKTSDVAVAESVKWKQEEKTPDVGDPDEMVENRSNVDLRSLPAAE